MVRLWDIYAWVYDSLRYFSPYVKLQNKVIDFLQLIPHLSILDLGCGTGNTIEKIQKKSLWGTRITAIDSSLNMLARAMSKPGALKNVSFRQGGLDQISANEKFDRITLINVLYAVKNPKETLRCLYDILEDGGILVVANPFIPDVWLVFREHFRDLWFKEDAVGILKFAVHFPSWLLLIGINQLIAKRGKRGTFHFLKPEELQEMAENASFKTLNRELIYGDGSVIMALQKDTGALVRRIQTFEELETAYHIRYQIYCEEYHMVPKENCSHGREVDEFDQHSIHFLLRVDGRVVGCLRLINDSSLGFLIEKEFSLPFDLVRSQTVEPSRNSILPDYRSNGIRGKNGNYAKMLEETAWDWSLKKGFTTWCLAMNVQLLPKRRNRGWKIVLLGDVEGRPYHNTVVIPVLRIS